MAIFDKKLILLDFDTKSKDQLFKALTDILFNEKKIAEVKAVYDAFWQREDVVTTGIGHGIAIPHARCSAVLVPTVLFARLKEPIDFDSLDNKPVSLVFMIAMPDDSADLHLEVLSKIAVKLLDEELMEQLKSSQEINQIFKILDDIQKGD